VVLALVIVACTPAPMAPKVDKTATFDRLREFQHSMMTKKGGLLPDEAKEMLKQFNTRLTDAEMPLVEEYALTNEGLPAAWAFAWFLADRGHYDAVANVMVTSLLETPEDRQYRMWKWWETFFGERENYKEMSRHIADALLKQFAEGTPARKLVVAEVFGKGEPESKWTLAEFKKAIGFDDAAK